LFSSFSSSGRMIPGVATAIGLLAATYLLIGSGLYGLSLFVILPAAFGAVAAWAAGARDVKRGAKTGAISTALATLAFLLLGWEGMICIVMTWPIAVPLGALGGLLMAQAQSRRFGRKAAGMLLFLPPLGVAWDVTADPPMFEVQTAIEIAAPPDVVWRNVVTFSDLPEPEEWFFKAGIAYPKRARIEGTGPGAIRYCEFSTGPFVEPIDVWDEPRLLQFRVTENPPPMEEWSPYQKVVPRHLHGYLVSERGQFRLIPLDGQRTLLEGTTWYRHGLRPSEYWRWWSDAIIHRIHLRVLNHIRDLSEKRQG
jgi:hypothetical protein